MSDAYPWYGLAYESVTFGLCSASTCRLCAIWQSDKFRGFASCRLIESISRKLLRVSSCELDCPST